MLTTRVNCGVAVDGDDEVGGARTDVDEGRGLAAPAAPWSTKRHWRRHRAHEGERLEVDAVDGEPGLPGGVDELLDHVALRGDDEDLLLAGPSSPAAVDRTSKSRMASASGIGMASWAWNSMAARSSFSSMIGNSMVRTTIFWFATPSENFLPVKPLVLPEGLELGGEPLDVDDLALEHQARGQWRARRRASAYGPAARP